MDKFSITSLFNIIFTSCYFCNRLHHRNKYSTVFDCCSSWGTKQCTIGWVWHCHGLTIGSTSINTFGGGWRGREKAFLSKNQHLQKVINFYHFHQQNSPFFLVSLFFLILFIGLYCFVVVVVVLGFLGWESMMKNNERGMLPYGATTVLGRTLWYM